MPSSRIETVLALIQVLLVAVGGIGCLLVLTGLASVPPAPPESDGFLTGGAYLYLGLMLVGTLGITGVGLVLPSVFGASGLLGFDHYQRRLVQAAAVCLGGGLLLAVAVSASVEFLLGALTLLLAIVLAFLLVSIALSWRVLEVAHEKLQKRTERAG